MELKDVEFVLNEEGKNEAFCKVTDDLELQIIKESKFCYRCYLWNNSYARSICLGEDLELQIIKESKFCYRCYLWNNSCARSICLGVDLDKNQVNDIIITLTH